MDNFNPSGAFDAQNEPDVQPLSGIFAPADLVLIGDNIDAPMSLTLSARSLVALVQEQPEYGNPNPLYGRFSLCNNGRSSRVHRATFRLCHQALDFLEADFLACEAEQIANTRRDLGEMEQIRFGVASIAVASAAEAERQAEECTHDEDGAPTAAYFLKCQSALFDVAQFGEFVMAGNELDLVSSIEEAIAVRRSFALADEALGVIRGAFEDVLREEVEQARKRFESIAGPLPPEPKREPETDDGEEDAEGVLV